MKNKKPYPDQNAIPIPFPTKLADPLYIQAYTLIDRIPRSRLKAILPQLQKLIGDTCDGPIQLPS